MIKAISVTPTNRVRLAPHCRWNGHRGRGFAALVDLRDRDPGRARAYHARSGSRWRRGAAGSAVGGGWPASTPVGARRDLHAVGRRELERMNRWLERISRRARDLDRSDCATSSASWRNPLGRFASASSATPWSKVRKSPAKRRISQHSPSAGYARKATGRADQLGDRGPQSNPSALAAGAARISAEPRPRAGQQRCREFSLRRAAR
jgi:hypothetical protein